MRSLPFPAQSTIDNFLGQVGVSFVDHRDYYNPDKELPQQWLDITTLPEDERDRPFAHIERIECVDPFINAIQGKAIMEEFDVSFLEEGNLQQLLVLREQKVAAGELADDERLRYFRGCYLHLDGAAAKGMPKKWGKTTTVMKLRVAGQTRGCCQLRPPFRIFLVAP